MKSVVLSSLWDKPASEAALFLISAKKAGIDVVMFTDDTAIEEQLRSYGATDVRLTGVMNCPAYSGNSQRYVYYKNWLDERGYEYDTIAMSDCRDVIFQLNIFDRLGKMGRARIYMEGQTIGNSDWNMGWLTAIYGKSVADKLANRRICCSGFVVGPRQCIATYLDAMVAEYSKTSVKLGGVDQGYANYIVWNQLVGDAIIPVDAAEVMTMGYLSEAEVTSNKHGDVLWNRSELIETPCVLHQYDRHPGTAARLREMYT